MRWSSPLCDLLSIDVPILQAPIGSATTPELAAAVSNAGALGSLALSWRSVDDVTRVVSDTRKSTRRPFAANVVLAWEQGDRVRAAIDGGVRIVWTFWGDPAEVCRMARESGVICLHTVGSEKEVAQAVDAGVDAIVAQGTEAGGHVRATRPLCEVLDRVLAATRLPVIAAGGVATRSDVAELLAAGAAGVCVGTRFLCTLESGAHISYKNAIVSASADDTVLTELFDGGWPHAPHRIIRNDTYRMWKLAGCPEPGSRPNEGKAVAWLPDGRPILRYDDAIPVAGMTGAMEELALYAGMGVSRIDDIPPAADIVRRLWDPMHESTDTIRA